ncbi:hypothetical protein [Psychroflexus aestuariivivens]|uniref:hypothetical protein n=1 Tax=Psychroflexus aestuariivivens TaxID=1795040 RepID=UPI000FD89D73|nr:hypothetical protein [Psychroflexus aestuariivivens]
MERFNKEARELIDKLEKAISCNDSKKVSKLYEESILIDWENVSDQLFGKYDDLIDKGNELLLK